MTLFLSILTLFSGDITYSDAMLRDKIAIENSQAKLSSQEAIKIGLKAINEHFEIHLDESELCSYDEGDYYLITIKIPENSLGGGVSAQVDAYCGKVLKVFFTE